MIIALLNITYQTTPSVEPLGSEQAACVFREAGYEILFYASSIDEDSDDALIGQLLKCDGVVFTGISNVRDILDQNYTRRDEIAQKLRNCGFGGFIAATGHQASLRPEQTLENCPSIDAVITGDPDIAARAIVRRLNDELPISGVIDMISTMDPNDWKGAGFVDTARYRPYLDQLATINQPDKLAAVIETSRGCSHSRCTFCSTAALVKKKKKARCALKPVNAIVDEMSYIHDKYGVSRFIMEDDFAAPPTPLGANRLEELSMGLAKLPFKPEYSIVIRPDAITDKTRPVFENLRESGLVLLYLGIESFDENDLALYGKNISFDALLKGVDIAQELGYKMDISSRYRIKPGLMPFHPYTTLEGIKNQSPYLAKYAITPVKMIAEVELYPGTELYDLASRDGLLAPGTRSGFRYRNRDVELFNTSMRECLKAMHRPRKLIRNIEKTVQGFGLNQKLVTQIRACRHEAEDMFALAYNELLDLCLTNPRDSDVKELSGRHRDQIVAFFSARTTNEAIERSWEEVAGALCSWYPHITPATDVSFSRPCWFPVIH